MKKGRVMQAAAFLMVTNLISRVLGYGRDTVLVNMFGMNWQTDAYNTAFRIPDTIYSVILGGAISAAFIPVFASYVAKKQTKDAWQVSNTALSWSLLLMGIAIAIAYIFTPQLIGILAPMFEVQTAQLSVALTRIMLLQPLFMLLSGVSMGILHSHQHFVWPAIGSLLYNVFIILGGLLLAGPIEARYPGYGIAGFSIGVVVGSIVYFLVQIPVLRKHDFHFRLSFNIHHPGFKKLLQLLVPVLIGLSVQQVNLLINNMLASGLEGGTITALGMAQKFMNVPIYSFAIAVAVAMFPTMTQQAALNDMPEFKKSMSLAIRTVAFICIPSAIGLIVLREPIVRILFEFSSDFTADDTIIVGQALLCYCIGLTFYGISQVLLRSFYALQNTLVPVLVSALTIAVNVVFSVLLVKPFAHMGLATAYSIAGIVQCLVLFLLLRKRLGQMDLKNMLISFCKSGAASLIMGLAAWGIAGGLAQVLNLGSKMHQLIQLCASMGVAIILFFVITYLLKMEESKLVIDIFKRRARRKRSAGTTSGGEGS